MIKEKFLKLEEKYSEYTNEYIYNEKQHISIDAVSAMERISRFLVIL